MNPFYSPHRTKNVIDGSTNNSQIHSLRLMELMSETTIFKENHKIMFDTSIKPKSFQDSDKCRVLVTNDRMARKPALLHQSVREFGSSNDCVCYEINPPKYPFRRMDSIDLSETIDEFQTTKRCDESSLLTNEPHLDLCWSDFDIMSPDTSKQYSQKIFSISRSSSLIGMEIIIDLSSASETMLSHKETNLFHVDPLRFI